MRIGRPTVLAIALPLLLGACTPEAWDLIDVLLEPIPPNAQQSCAQASGLWVNGACWITEEQAACEGLVLDGECHVEKDLD